MGNNLPPAPMQFTVTTSIHQRGQEVVHFDSDPRTSKDEEHKGEGLYQLAVLRMDLHIDDRVLNSYLSKGEMVFTEAYLQQELNQLGRHFIEWLMGIDLGKLYKSGG